MTRILVLGTMEIDFDRNINVTSTTLNKPDFKSSALWGSSLIKLPGGKINSSWKDFTAGDYTAKDFKFGVSFKLNRKSKILQITSLDDYLSIMNKYKCLYYEDRYCLDFAKISKDYDAFHLTEDAFWSLRLPMGGPLYELGYDNFYSYDAESWIIFNLDAINKGSVLNHNNIFGSWEE